MLARCEEARTSWDAIARRLPGQNPGPGPGPGPGPLGGVAPAALLDARPDGHGHAVAAVGVVSRRSWGRTVIVSDLSRHAPSAEVQVPLADLEERRRAAEAEAEAHAPLPPAAAARAKAAS